MASRNDHCGIVRMLLETKADVNITTDYVSHFQIGVHVVEC